VLNYNGLHLLRNCLDSLLVAASDRDELIVVDNGSTDGSAAAIREEYPTVRLVALEENFCIFGLNAGVAAAKGEYVAFLNNDMTVEPEFVERSLARFDAPDVFAVCPRILTGDGDEQGSRTAGHWHRGLIIYESLAHVERPTDCFFAVGGQSFFRRDRLVQLGSIDPLLWPMYHEDIELSYRAWKAGWRIRYAPDALCHHLGTQTNKKVWTSGQLRSFVRQNEFLTVWKNVTDRRMLATHLALVVPRVVAAGAKKDWPTVMGFGRAVRRLPECLAGRRQARKHFVRSDREVFELVSGIAAPEPRVELQA
jgi:GT2 family glycosyltransferase